MRRKNAWTTYNKKQLDELEKLCKNYLKFLDKGKTERECVKQIVKQAEEKGYVNLADITKDKKALKAGDKVYSVCMDKTVAACANMICASGIPTRSTACAHAVATCIACGSALPTSSLAQIIILLAINVTLSPAYNIFAR